MNFPLPAADAMLHRLSVLPDRFASTIIGLAARDVDRTIDAMLQQIGEALGADQATFENVAGDPLQRGAIRVWTRAGAVGGETVLRVPVTLDGRPISELTIGARDGTRSWPPAISERLRLLADLMVLAVQRGQQLRDFERERPAPPLRGSVRSASVASPGLDGDELDDIVGESPALRMALARVLEVAPTDASVVILGETGTGKELFARYVHNRSTRRDRPFIAVNCAALPPTLIESELFGHERGAFTGATSLRQGRFELAHRGTIFLDEIGDLPAEVQAKLLRVLQEGEFERVGSSQSRKVDVRVIAATHHNLEAAVKEGRFRSDLYYRLNVFPIALPALRDRTEDIPRLVWFFINRDQRNLNRRFTSVPPAVLATLQRHSWPGNIRELENVVARAMIHSTGDTLLLDDGPGFHMSTASDRSGTLEDVERRHIEDALQQCRGRINGSGNAAEKLGLHPNTLRFRMKKLGILRPAGLSVVRDFTRPVSDVSSLHRPVRAEGNHQRR